MPVRINYIFLFLVNITIFSSNEVLMQDTTILPFHLVLRTSYFYIKSFLSCLLKLLIGGWFIIITTYHNLPLMFGGKVSSFLRYRYRELRTTYLTTVAKLSNLCDNDGLRAILEMFIEVATELRDTIALELGQVGISIENVCFNDLVDATTTAKNSLSNQDAYLKCIQGLW